MRPLDEDKALRLPSEHYGVEELTRRGMASAAMKGCSEGELGQTLVCVVRHGAAVGAPGSPSDKIGDELRATAVMVCWNVHPCTDTAFVNLSETVQRVDPENVAHDALLGRTCSSLWCTKA